MVGSNTRQSETRMCHEGCAQVFQEATPCGWQQLLEPRWGSCLLVLEPMCLTILYYTAPYDISMISM